MRKLLTILAVTTVLLAVSICNLANDTQTYGPTTADDHLWFIAQKTRPNRNISKQQMMIAILKANPEAFTDNNVNGLQEGQTLKIPTLEMINTISPVTALIQVSAQNAAWVNKNDYEQPVSNGHKAPPFGTIKHARNPESIQVQQSFSNPTTTTEQTQNQNNQQPQVNSEQATQPIVSNEISQQSPQQKLSDYIPLINEEDPLADALQSAFASNNTRLIFNPLLTLNIPLIQALISTFQSNSETSTTSDASQILQTTKTETLPKNDLIAQINNLTQQFQAFLIRINQLDQYTRERLDVIEDEQVAMKNQITSLHKQIRQLKDNYLQDSTPIFHQSAFAQYGIWIMGSSVIACLLVLIYSLSRQRRRKEDVNKKISATIKRKKVLPEEEVEIIEVIEDEYDYLGSQEGIAAKLDLARAYIDMGNSSQAILVLNEVIAHGNDEQRHRARKILEDVVQDTVH